MDIHILTEQLSAILLLVLHLSLPPIAVAATVGVAFSLVQALTQIQEQTLSFAVKLLAVSFALYLTASSTGSELYQFALHSFESIKRVGR